MFDLEVLSLHGSWVIKLNGRIVSGSATLSGAENVARHAAESLVRSGYQVRLATPTGEVVGVDGCGNGAGRLAA